MYQSQGKIRICSNCQAQIDAAASICEFCQHSAERTKREKNIRVKKHLINPKSPIPSIMMIGALAITAVCAWVFVPNSAEKPENAKHTAQLFSAEMVSQALANADFQQSNENDVNAGFIGISSSETKIDYVYPNSPAAKAGLLAGDFICALDGVAVGPDYIKGIPGRPDTTIQVSVRREGNVLTFTCIRKQAKTFVDPETATKFTIKP